MGLDLFDAVTVFVTTVGASTFDDCMQQLRAQDCAFRLRIIDHVAPMNAAFQRMLDQCTTPYYVQVDEDMLLHPHAVRALYESIEAAGPRVAIFAAELYDVHLQRCIHGLKIFRHDVVRHYPLGGGVAFELDQVAQLERDGYTVIRPICGVEPTPGRTLGLHGTEWTPRSIYERYATLERTRRTRASRRQWFAPYASEFMRRFVEDPCEQNFFALMGVVAGVIASCNGEAAAKDYRSYDKLAGFEALRQFLREVRDDHASSSPSAPFTPDPIRPPQRADSLRAQSRSIAQQRRNAQR